VRVLIDDEVLYDGDMISVPRAGDTIERNTASRYPSKPSIGICSARDDFQSPSCSDRAGTPTSC
jgi:hypothetical protein